MDIDKIRKEIQNAISDYADDTFYFLKEYGEYDQAKMEQIINIFCEEYREQSYLCISDIFEDAWLFVEDDE